MSALDILVVEGDKLLAQELREQLVELGYRIVDIACSGMEAIEKIERQQPRVVLMNTRLKGGINGLQMKNPIHDFQDIPVVYVVDYGDQATIGRGETAAPFGYIFRPFDAKQIFATIETALLRHDLERKLEQSRQWLNTTLTSIGDGVIATDEQGLVRFINPIAVEQTGWHQMDAIGRPLSDVFSLVDEYTREPIDIVQHPNTLSRRAAKNGFNGLLVQRDGMSIPVEANITYIDDGKGKVYGTVLVFRDVTQQREALHEIERQASRAEALLQVASQLNSQLELRTVLNTICRITNQTISANGTAVVLQGKQKDVFRDMAASGQDPDFQSFLATALEIPKEIFENVLSMKNPVAVIQEIQDSPIALHFEVFEKLDIKTLALAALFREDELIGCLISAFARKQRVLPEDELTLLRGLADQASSAIENAELFEQVRASRERQRKLAKSLVDIQEGERRHIARELHDHLGQLLTGLQFMLETTKSQASGRQRTNLDEIQNTVTDIIEQVREMSLNLRPGMLDDLGLIPTLQWHFERFSRQTGIRVNFQSDEVLSRFPAEIETAAYRIIQEALTNVARHAKVKFVFVGVAIQQDTLWVEVVDTGRGFDASSVLEKPSSGLGGMRERAELAGGYLLVRSIVEQGTHVIAALPIHENRLERRKNVRKGSFG
jgi:PAS domain S-box-containing protein